MTLKCLTMSVLIVMLSNSLAVAQTGNVRRGWLYSYAGFGGTSSARSLHIGGGGEFLAAGGFGLGLEAGHFAATARPVDNSLSIVCANLSYHFGGREVAKKAVPFLAGGISFGNGRSGGGNFGGGIQYWFHERVALRLEFREHIFSSDSPYLYGIHFGLAFR